MFLFDNGGLGGYFILGIDCCKGMIDNYFLCGGKGILYEGGVCVLCIVFWLGMIFMRVSIL